MRHLHIDFETCSTLDLRKVGVSRYSRHPSTKVLCVAWRWDNDPNVHARLLPTGRDIQVIFDGGPASQTDYRIHAWNASFERHILRHKYGIMPETGTFMCSMQVALYEGLPAKLETAAVAMKLKHRKDTAGHKLMMKMTKPLKDGTFMHEDPFMGTQWLLELAEYCKQDVIVEFEAHSKMQGLPGMERMVSVMDQHINDRGIRIDTGLVKRLHHIAEVETARLDTRCAEITNRQITSPGTQTARLMGWLARNGAPITSLGKDDVEETLATAPDADLHPDIIEVLAIRSKIAKSSNRKLASVTEALDEDDRIRNTLQYYAARTGRWGGRLLQPQNLPRPEKWARQAVEDVQAGATGSYLNAFYGDTLTVVSNCIRGTIIPSEGKVFYVFDFSQIEARVIAWLAGQQDVLDAFREHDRNPQYAPDVYEWTAERNGVPAGPTQRTAGKVMVLGLGFGAGPDRFMEIAKTYGLTLGRQEAETMVYGWREANPKIVALWRGIDIAAKTGLEMPTLTPLPFSNNSMMILDVNALIHQPPEMLMSIKLPADRHLFYRNARLEPDPQWGSTIWFDGMDKGQWGPIKTYGAKLAENVTQAVARDIMVAAMMRVENYLGSHLKPVLTVHDEVVFEGPPLDTGDPNVFGLFDKAKDCMEVAPQWASGLPIACAGKMMPRYGKD
jgi:DNA polymerase